jgi:hypothetical protein
LDRTLDVAHSHSSMILPTLDVDTHLKEVGNSIQRCQLIFILPMMKIHLTLIRKLREDGVSKHSTLLLPPPTPSIPTLEALNVENSLRKLL